MSQNSAISDFENGEETNLIDERKKKTYIRQGLMLFRVFSKSGMKEKEEQEEEEEYQERLLELMAMYQRYHDIIWDEAYVTRGSKMTCTYGTKPALLDALIDHGVYKGALPVMTCMDCRLENLHNFGSCMCPEITYRRKGDMTVPQRNGSVAWKAPGNLLPHICVPLIDEQDGWHMTIGDVYIKNEEGKAERVLTRRAYLACRYGGVITIPEVPCENAGISSKHSNGVYVVITKVLNIREEPSADSASLSRVQVKDRINVIDSTINPKGELWAKIDLGDDRVGWVADRYILPDKPIETVFPDIVTAYVDGVKTDLTPLKKWGAPGKGKYTGKKLMTKDGRYKVAIGPKVMNPKYQDYGEVEKEDFEAFDKNIKVIVFNKKEKKEETLPCFVEDWKAHTYNEYPVEGHTSKEAKVQVIVESGMLQTGIRYPYAHNDTEWASGTLSGNIIEFCSDNTGNLNCDDYILRRVIVKLVEKE